ncbi:MAG: phosphoribosyltransferase [Bacteroidetes bacterium]|nr:phosphoribosyltransferase [Bacteroidota bacterium]
MDKQRLLILDKERIGHKLQRMAYEIWEHNANEKSIILLGIETSGLVIAKNLAARLKEISQLKAEVIPLKINKRNPITEDITIQKDLAKCCVVLVDDVANSGKTLLYALKPILNYETKKIMIAVLVDRKHKSYPVSPDIVGHSVATTMQDHIEVETKGNEIIGAYLQ